MRNFVPDTQMPISQALSLTGTKNRNQLARYLGISATATYKWPEDNIPQSGQILIFKKIGAFDQLKTK